MKRYIFIICTLCISYISNAKSFNEVLSVIVKNNPELKAKIKNNESVLSAMKQDNTLQAPEVDFEHNWSDTGLGVKWGISVSQYFDWPGKYYKQRKAINATSQAMDYLDQCFYLDKMLEVKILLIDIINVSQNIALINEVKSNIDLLIEKYNKAYQNGEVTILDVNKLKIQQISINRKLSSLNIQKGVLYSTLKSLNGGIECNEMIENIKEYPSDTLYSEDDYVRFIDEFDPEIEYYQMQMESSKEQVSVAKMNRYPGFSIGYKYTKELGDGFNGFSVGVTLPFFSQKHKIKSVQALNNADAYNLEQIKINKLTSIYSNRGKALILKSEIDEYKSVFEDSNNLLLLKKALDGGEISLINYLQEMNYFIEAKQNYIDVLYQYHLNLAELNKYRLVLQN